MLVGFLNLCFLYFFVLLQLQMKHLFLISVFGLYHKVNYSLKSELKRFSLYLLFSNSYCTSHSFSITSVTTPQSWWQNCCWGLATAFAGQTPFVCVCVWPSACGQSLMQECASGKAHRETFWQPTNGSNGWQKRFCPLLWQRQAWRQSSLFRRGCDEMSLMTAWPGLASFSLNVIWRESYWLTLAARGEFITSLCSNIIRIQITLDLFLSLSFSEVFQCNFCFSLIYPNFLSPIFYSHHCFLLPISLFPICLQYHCHILLLLETNKSSYFLYIH